MTRPLRHNQPHEHLNPPDTLQRYAADRLHISLAPKPPAVLDAESRSSIDAAAILCTAVAAYCPQHREKLRAILRDMLAAQIRVTTVF